MDCPSNSQDLRLILRFISQTHTCTHTHSPAHVFTQTVSRLFHSLSLFFLLVCAYQQIAPPPPCKKKRADRGIIESRFLSLLGIVPSEAFSLQLWSLWSSLLCYPHRFHPKKWPLTVSILNNRPNCRFAQPYHSFEPFRLLISSSQLQKIVLYAHTLIEAMERLFEPYFRIGEGEKMNYWMI